MGCSASARADHAEVALRCDLGWPWNCGPAKVGRGIIEVCCWCSRNGLRWDLGDSFCCAEWQGEGLTYGAPRVFQAAPKRVIRQWAPSPQQPSSRCPPPQQPSSCSPPPQQSTSRRPRSTERPIEPLGAGCSTRRHSRGGGHAIASPGERKCLARPRVESQLQHARQPLADHAKIWRRWPRERGVAEATSAAGRRSGAASTGID
mmetsp:Transcript_88044/g.188933  ORF Transcript_88044/g.188933 Transcript_88044/m.188933 type:complete len:204 (+) Transcript_88044:398-1009(+)